VQGDGSVTAVRVVEDAGEPRVARCIAKLVSTWRFRAPRGGGGYPPAPVPGFGISLIGSPESYGCMPMPERCASTPTCACVMCTDEHACDADEDPSGCGDCFLFASCADSSQGQPMVTFTEW